MRIYAKTLRGQTIPLDVVQHDTVSTMKLQITDKIGTPHQSFCINFQGSALCPSAKLLHCNIRKGSVVYVVDCGDSQYKNHKQHTILDHFLIEAFPMSVLNNIIINLPYSTRIIANQWSFDLTHIIWDYSPFLDTWQDLRVFNSICQALGGRTKRYDNDSLNYCGHCQKFKYLRITLANAEKMIDDLAKC